MKRLYMMSAVILTSTLCMSTVAHAGTDGTNAVKEASTEKSVKKAETTAVKPKKITDRRHPDYIRCRKEPIIGSLSKKRKICMTNAKWKEHFREGNKRANEMVEESRSGFRPGN